VERPAAAELDEQTFYGFIAASEAFKKAGFAHREAFGQVGFGTGGWDTDFPNSILEILRVVYTDADDQHRLIAGERSAPRGTVAARAVGHGALAGRNLTGVAALRLAPRRGGQDQP
jgi:hypothetical protein